MPRLDVVKKVSCLLVCPWCSAEVTECYATSLNKVFTPQVKTVAKVGHVVAVLAGELEGSRELFVRCPESSLAEPVRAVGLVGLRELEAAKARVAATAGGVGAAAPTSIRPGGRQGSKGAR